MATYSVLVKRYNRNINFDSLEELREELRSYFAKSETSIVERLVNFKMKLMNENGFKYMYGENNYQDIKVCCYDDAD